jgi:hypothetical protein
MGIMQDEFERILEDELSKTNLATKLLRRAFNRRGVAFTEGQLAEAAAKVAAAPEGTEEVSISIDNGILDEEIDLTEDLAAGLSEFEGEFASNIEEAIPKAIEETWPGVLSALYSDLPKALRHRRANERRFAQRLRSQWKGGLDRLEMLLMIAQESGQVFLADVNKAITGASESVVPDECVLLDALVRIHARSCRIASEVLCLLKGGFADGANARWRSLHENAVIAMFICQYGGDAAKRYLRHSVVECHKNAISYQEHCQSLGQTPLSTTEIVDLKSAYDAALSEFGSEFRHEYGWAANAIGNKKPTFTDIEQHLDLDRWRPYFKLACHSVHAGPQGLYFSLANGNDPEPTLIAGASNFGLSDPAHCCAVSLMMVSVATFTSRSNMDGLVAIKVMMQLCDDIGAAFLKAHNQLEDEIEADK